MQSQSTAYKCFYFLIQVAVALPLYAVLFWLVLGGNATQILLLATAGALLGAAVLRLRDSGPQPRMQAPGRLHLRWGRTRLAG